MKDVVVERLSGGKDDLFVASGYLVIKHYDGTVQEIYQSGQCTIRANLGHARKGAITDLIKKALSQLGIAGDVYSGIGTQHDVPPEGGKGTAETMDAEKSHKAWAALFRDIDKRLREHPKSVHKSGYTPKMAWDDADRLWPDAFALDHPPFKTVAEALDCFSVLPVPERKALYAKVNNKWRHSDKALQDAKYGAAAEPPDDYRPDDAGPQPTPENRPGPRRPKMGDVVAPKFKLWCQKVLGVRTWAQAEPVVNQCVRLYAERNKRADLTDWLDLDAVATQNIRALLQEEVTKGTLGKRGKS